VAGHHPFDGGEALAGAFHDIVACAAVNVDVDESRRKDRIAEVHNSCVSWNSYGCAWAHNGDSSFVDQQRGIVNPLQRGKQSLG